jgi:hypothetical protein
MFWPVLIASAVVLYVFNVFERPLNRKRYALAAGILIVVAVNVIKLLTFYGRDRVHYSEIWEHLLRVYGWQAHATVATLLAAFLFLSFARLRDAGLPAVLAVLTLVPGVNFVFGLLLAMFPTADANAVPVRHPWIPNSYLGAATMAILITLPVGLAFTVFGVKFWTTYGWVLFVASPFVLGFVAVALAGLNVPRTLPQCIAIAATSATLLLVMLLLFAIEGVICIAIAMPIVYPLALLGGLVGYLVQHRPALQARAPQMMGALLFVVPMLMGAEAKLLLAPQEFATTSSIVIDAPPERIWPHLVTLDGLPQPRETLFRAGATYPIGTQTIGSGVGATRLCIFSAGPVKERIDIWKPGRELTFTVLEQPEMMRELTPYAHIDVPHVRLHYVRSRGGQFRLTPLGSGRTLVEGTSWYESKLWPAPYWRLWTDHYVHQVHARVFARIKHLAER